MSEHSQLKEGTTAALEAETLLLIKQNQKIIDVARGALAKELASRKIDKWDTRDSAPLDAEMQKTLLKIFDVIVYQGYFKHAISQKFPKGGKEYLESPSGERLTLTLQDLSDDMVLTPCLAAIKATPQFAQSFGKEEESTQNERARAFVGTVIGCVISALEHQGIDININKEFGDFSDPSKTRITLSNIEGKEKCTLEGLRSEMIEKLNKNPL